MKNICFLVLSLIFIACSNSEDITNELNKLRIESLNQFVPVQNLENHSIVVFKDVNGNEKKLNISHSSSTETSEIDEIQYEREIKSFTLSDSLNSEYVLNILMSSHYQDVSTVILSIDCSLLTNVNNGWIPSIRLDEDGNSRIGNKEDITLGLKEFIDVFSNLELPDIETKYSKIFYNYELGFVGFYDSENHLWYLDRYEE